MPPPLRARSSRKEAPSREKELSDKQATSPKLLGRPQKPRVERAPKESLRDSNDLLRAELQAALGVTRSKKRMRDLYCSLGKKIIPAIWGYD